MHPLLGATAVVLVACALLEKVTDHPLRRLRARIARRRADGGRNASGQPKTKQKSPLPFKRDQPAPDLDLPRGATADDAARMTGARELSSHSFISLCLPGQTLGGVHLGVTQRARQDLVCLPNHLGEWEIHGADFIFIG